jgi:AraC family transcriptional regulator
MIKWVLATLLGGIIGLCGYLYWHLGGWKEVSVAKTQYSELYMLSKSHMGPYHKIVPVIQEVETWAKANSIECKKSFGEYLDKPDQVEEIRLRSKGGCLLSAAEFEQLKNLGTENTRFKINLPEGFELSHRPAAEYIVASFEGSPGIGPMKVYPKVEQFMTANNLKSASSSIEIYEIKDGPRNMTTTYLFGL